MDNEVEIRPNMLGSASVWTAYDEYEMPQWYALVHKGITRRVDASQFGNVAITGKEDENASEVCLDLDLAAVIQELLKCNLGDDELMFNPALASLHMFLGEVEDTQNRVVFCGWRNCIEDPAFLS
ncbi:unnamed protein product [Arabidopsis thaliana]|uniref:(thale cress) hypothetical protein n=1 Tax=Arabidopsis thaliana TaxID=3702 RepID=A0A7G2FHQ2_ARATH|nr:unnamed protein product [Arabidopsis thaliana]